MITLNNILVMKTKNIKQFSDNMQEAKKNSDQKKIDDKFSEVIDDIKYCIKHIYIAVTYSSFHCNEEIKEKLKNILIECKNTIDQRLVSSSKIAYLHKELREIESELNTDWYKYFKEETSSINEILKLAQNISNADVSKIRFNINSAESWNDNHDIKKIEIFTKSLSEAKDLIDKLELNEDILNFLRKMVISTATVTDLTDDVLHWLKKENLEKRVKLSF